ncbi:MAG: FeoA family protein [Candidatus Sumerlaeia bacterium]|nr:FeoA family protein [Candidatus Sumerlaeia bacterium]
MTLALDKLKPGQTATVLEVGGEPVLAQRLMALGLVEGANVEFLRTAPLGDPIEIRVDGAIALSLRAADARAVSVSPNP